MNRRVRAWAFHSTNPSGAHLRRTAVYHILNENVSLPCLALLHHSQNTTRHARCDGRVDQRSHARSDSLLCLNIYLTLSTTGVEMDVQMCLRGRSSGLFESKLHRERSQERHLSNGAVNVKCTRFKTPYPAT